MAHLPPPSVPEFPGFSQSKTLILSMPGIQGIVVTRRGQKMSQRPSRRFRDAHAALDWCIAKEIGLVFMPTAPDPARN
jgi:hypothetical protein